MSRMMSGSPILMGDNTVPGVKIHKEVRELLPEVFKACTEFDLDYYPTIIEFMTYDDISEIASYGGFPVRYPHWSFGMEYEELARGYEYGQYRISEMVVNCLDLNTPIFTNYGTLPAAEVKAGMKVYCNGTREVALVKNQHSSLVYEITCRGLAKPIVCTPNHKWWTLGSNRFYWKETSSLKVGNKLVGNKIAWLDFDRAADLPWTSERCLKETSPGNHWRLKKINPPKIMTVELAELMGAIIGDGHLNEKNNLVSVCVDRKLTDYSQRISDLFETVFGVPSTEHSHSDSTFDHALDFLDTIGLMSNWRHDTKRIPWSIQQSGQKYRQAFLRGYFDTGGYACGQLGCSSNSLDLISQVQVMLLEMGIASNYKHIDNDHNSIHTLIIQGKWNRRKFKDMIGFNIKHKVDGNKEMLNKCSCVSRGIELPYFQKALIKLADKLSLRQYGQIKLYERLRKLKRQPIGCNVLYGFVEQLQAFVKNIPEATALRSKLNKIKNYLETPYFVVENVRCVGSRETIDIALFGKHDFTASGLVTHNTNPCVIYCMDSNTLVNNINVIAHAIGHNDFFKNNVFFTATNRDMMNKMANHGSRIRKYMARWGKETVTTFIDHCLRLDTLIDPAKAWKDKVIKEAVIRDDRQYEFPNRLRPDHTYMDNWVNPLERLESEREEIRKREIAQQIGLLEEPERDIFGFLKDHAPLKPWQQDIISMLYEEALYFAPQRATKTINEGWASYCDFNIMCRKGLCALGQKHDGSGIVEYAKHKMSVLGGKYSQNPYKLGYELFMDIEERWDKGRFGQEYDDCKSMNEKENWDKKLGLGHEKVFEVRKHYNDILLIAEFFTQEFCEKKEFYEYLHKPNGEWIIASKDFHRIKSKLMQRYGNGGLPDVRLVEPNYCGQGWMLLQHYSDGRNLYTPYVNETLTSLYRIWQNTIVLASKNSDDEEIVFVCNGTTLESVRKYDRDEYDNLHNKR